jgi:hypothetical protein
MFLSKFWCGGPSCSRLIDLKVSDEILLLLLYLFNSAVFVVQPPLLADCELNRESLTCYACLCAEARPGPRPRPKPGPRSTLIRRARRDLHNPPTSSRTFYTQLQTSPKWFMESDTESSPLGTAAARHHIGLAGIVAQQSKSSPTLERVTTSSQEPYCLSRYILFCLRNPP